MHKKSWDADDSRKEILQNKIATYSPMVYRLAYALVKTEWMRMIFIRKYF